MRIFTLLLVSLMLTSGALVASQTVTSTLQGARLDFIAEKDSVVKKGETLVKFGTSSTMAKLASAKANLQAAEADLKDKTGDLQRYSTLKESNSASAEKLEETTLEYNYAVLSVAQCKSTIKSLEANLNMSIIPAPYDCKITKVFLLQNSGADFGQSIMEIEPISDLKPAIDSTENSPEKNIMTVSSTMYGCVVTYLAEERQIVKKGELLAKLVNPVTEAELDGLKAEVNYAEHLVETSKSAFKRYSKLKGKSSSFEYSENIELAYEEAKYKLEIAKKDVEYYELYNASGIIKAPFDCKVIKVILILKDGTEAGLPIMEIIPIKAQASDKTPLEANTADAVSVTSLLDEKVITYLPEENQIVKKGEDLLKLKTAAIDIEIEKAKLDLAYAEVALKHKEKDYKRCSYLKANKSTSPENCENSELAYETAKASVENCKAKLSFINNKKAKAIITAPYDCKITKVLRIVGGGVQFGTPVLEAEKL